MPRTDLDVIDGKILAELQNDARQSNVELARRVGLSPSPCLARVPEVMECYLMTGDSDYLIRILVRDNSEVERFIVQKLSTIEGVANIKSSFALKQVKYKTETTVSA